MLNNKRAGNLEATLALALISGLFTIFADSRLMAIESTGEPANAGQCTGPDSDDDGTPDDCDLCPGSDDSDDLDADGIPDGCDPCAGGAASRDADGDGDVDWHDYAALSTCLTSPDDALAAGCECFDINNDSDVDLQDARFFAFRFAPGPSCRIQGRDYDAGDTDAFPNNCRKCSPGISTTSWSTIAAGAICNEGSGDVCDRDEVCNGVSDRCPLDVVEPESTLCRFGSGDVCDPSEFCTGVADEPCPTDQLLPLGAVCRAGSGDICDPTERCSGVAGESCPTDMLAPQGFICNPGSGDACDRDERCSGNSGEPCPVDSFEPSTTVCRAGSGDFCDPDEMCPGVADEGCPSDVLRDNTVLCRAAPGICDVEEFCPGVPGDPCPADAKESQDVVCREAVGICDEEETCDGVRNTCPPDALRPADYVCRGSGITIEPDGTIFIDGDGLCDIEEKCTGQHVDCPPDRLRPRDALCRDRTGPCDNTREFCTENSGKHCPRDESTSTQLCRIPNGPCDVPEYCDPTSPQYPECPTDEFEAAGTLCRDFGPTGPFPNFRACDEQEFCTGNGANCPDNESLPIGTTCERNDGSTGQCQDVGLDLTKCVEAGTLADGATCDADFECASGNCSEMIDRSKKCIPAEFVGFGGTCDGNDAVAEGDPQGRWCYGEDSNTLWCCKGSTWAKDGETGSCKECCLSEGTGDERDVDCDNGVNHGPRTFCCSGRCTDTENDPHNCGECGIDCLDGENVCREFVECQPSNPDGLPEPGQCIYQNPCGSGEACWDNCISCGFFGNCDTCQSVATCFDLTIEVDTGLCSPCSFSAECAAGQFCQDPCGEVDPDANYNSICLGANGYCVEESGDCVEP